LLRIQKLVRNRVIDFGIEKVKIWLVLAKEGRKWLVLGRVNRQAKLICLILFQQQELMFWDGLTGKPNTYDCFRMILAD
jgi:hypothetical protein